MPFKDYVKLPSINLSLTEPRKVAVGMESIWKDSVGQVVGHHTNIQLGDTSKRLIAAAAIGAASGLGIPAVSAVASSMLTLGDGVTPDQQYAAVPFENLFNEPWMPMQDFRARLGKDPEALLQKRLDGASAAIRGSGRAAAYAAASATIGAYNIFNLETTYGLGDPGNIWAIRQDFTMRSHIATKWKSGVGATGLGNYDPTRNPIEIVTPFRGDRVNATDFGMRSLKGIYRWRPARWKASDPGPIADLLDKMNQTQDLIKFFFTGPNLHPTSTGKDDVMVFRAIITSLTDSFNPSWTPQQMVGRADPNYIYSGVSRDININFTVYATDRDELKPIWRKLNALASYTAPEYDNESIGLIGPWMRMTLGDLLYQQPVIISSLYYTLADTETTWETNITKDPDMFQVPKKVEVSMILNVIPEYLPQKGGKMYTLSKAKRNLFGKATGETVGWLNDAIPNPGAATAGEFDDLKETSEEKITWDNIKEKKAELLKKNT